jgi:hypothetical protein
VFYSQLVAAGCILGKTDAEIGSAVSTLVKRSAEYNARRQREIAAKASISASAARLPAPDTRPTPGGV